MDIFQSIIIPAYNEQHYIENALNEILDYFKDKDYKTEILIVNDGSKDRTEKIINDFIQKNFSLAENDLSEKISIIIINNEKNSGKGFSIKKGILQSHGKYILFTDTDLSTPIEEFDKLFFFLNNGYDIAIASRDLPESFVIRHQNIIRESMGKLFNYLVRKITKLDFRDTQCGFKLFKKEAAFIIFPKIKTVDFGFDVELLFIANKLGFKIKEVPVKWENSKDSKVNIIKDSAKMFFDLLKLKKMHNDL